jgi:hypothetical protein
MTHPVKWIFLLSLIISLAAWIGCEEDITSPDEGSPVPSIVSWEVPAKMAFNSPKTDRILVMVEDGQGPTDVPFVLCTLLDGGATIDTFTLWDDGSFYEVAAHLPWASTVSGDLVPRDGIFSRRISGQFVDQQTDVTFRFNAADLDGHTASTVDVAVEVRANSAPVLENPQLPDTLVSGFDPVTLSIRAYDPDDLDSLVRVWLEVEGSGKEDMELDGPDADDRWSISIERSFAVCIEGDFQFKFYAEDTFQEIGGPVGGLVTVENDPPTLSNLIAVDTMYLPTQADTSDTSELYVDVDDDQTLADIIEVTFTSVRNDTIPNPNIFYLFDDGTGADEVAGDGTYSQGIVLFWNNPVGKYTFTFRAKDCVDQLSDSLTHDMWVVPQPGTLATGEQKYFKEPMILPNDRLCNPFQAERRQR